jgi:predicted ribosomally synthesized peptide with SipW-like signal peptide
MQRIILSLALIVGTLGALGFGATTAFFSDTETSVANTFTAGDVDLKIDNESYYNGLFNKGTSWGEDDLDGNEYKFFDFDDLKPGDYGEDTISIHVDTNDAYLCANVTLTSNNENTCNEPEALDDQTCGTSTDSVGAGLGELAGLVEFIWWADDGDNVFESDEEIISEGKLDGLGVGGTYPLTLADSSTNIWNVEEEGGPVDGNTTYYIGKAWCFGNIGTAAVPTDEGDNGRTPAGDNNDDDDAGTPEDGGLTCDGSFLNNGSQTDSLTADIAFSAVQARHNDKFLCEKPRAPGGTLTLVKQVLNSGPFSELPTAWTLSADGVTEISGVSGSGAVTNAYVATGTYNLSEVGPQGYTASNWSCVGGTQNDNDTVTIAEDEDVTCTVTNYVNCQATQRYADTVVSSAQALRKNGTAVLPERSNASSSLGAPQSSGLPSDPAVAAGTFFSLGFGGSIIVRFDDNYIVDGPGNDLQVWEVTGGVYPDELIALEASQDGVTYFPIGSGLTRDAVTDLGLSGLSWARYIKLTDISNPASFSDLTADGFDLDAFSALTCAERLPVQNDV